MEGFFIQSMGPLELAALGLSTEEITRIMVVLEFATRAIRRDRRRKLGSMEGTVREIRLRAQAWPRSVIGIIGVDTYDRVILDKVMHEGIEQWVPIDLQGLLRECLRAGCNALVVYRWSPRPDRLVAAGGDDGELRVALRLRTQEIGDSAPGNVGSRESAIAFLLTEIEPVA